MTSAGPVGRVDDQQRPQDGLQGCCRVARNAKSKTSQTKKERRKGTKTKIWLLRAMHLMAEQTKQKMLAVSFGAGPEGNDVG